MKHSSKEKKRLNLQKLLSKDVNDSTIAMFRCYREDDFSLIHVCDLENFCYHFRLCIAKDYSFAFSRYIPDPFLSNEEEDHEGEEVYNHAYGLVFFEKHREKIINIIENDCSEPTKKEIDDFLQNKWKEIAHMCKKYLQEQSEEGSSDN